MSDTLCLGTLTNGEPFEVPLEVAKYSQALMAVTGLGKSNAAVVMGEQMFRAGIPWVAIDPKGDWYGIRYSATDGEPGLPIPVFGGLYGNSPLRPGMGARMAELVVELNMTCVLDVSDFDSKNEMLAFINDFVKTLFRLHAKKRTLRHVFLEECDDYMPQKVVGGEGVGGKNVAIFCLATCQKLVKQGRVRGLGCTMISQRPAVVNKDALTQIQTLYVLGMTSPQDRNAIKAWVDYHVGAKEIVDSLPTLEPGEAWCLSPRVLKRIERITFSRRWTMDTGSTPDVGETSETIGTMATIDMGAIEKALADVIEQAKEHDPLELRKRLKVVEGQLKWWEAFHTKLVPGDVELRVGSPFMGNKYRLVDALAEPEAVVEEVEVQVRVPFVPPEVVEVGEQLVGLADRVVAFARDVGDIADQVAASLETLPEPTVVPPARPTGGTTRRTESAPKSPKTQVPASRQEDTPRAASPKSGPQPVLDFALYETHRRIIGASLDMPDADSRKHAFLAGYHAKTKSYTNALGQLRTGGYLVGFRLTAAGEQLAEDLGIEVGLDPWEHWYHHPKVPPIGRRILDRVRDEGPQGMEELADFLGYGNVKTKSFTNVVGLLRGLGLLTKGWPVQLTELMGG